MDVLITVKVDQGEALQAIMDLQALGYTLAGFDVGSVVVPLPKAKAPMANHTKWNGNTRVRVKRIPQETRMRGGSVVVPVLKALGIGWEGTYQELADFLEDRRPDLTGSGVRAYRAMIKNAGCLEVIA